jgi:hypothetical protein
VIKNDRRDGSAKHEIATKPRVRRRIDESVAVEGVEVAPCSARSR